MEMRRRQFENENTRGCKINWVAADAIIVNNVSSNRRTTIFARQSQVR